MLRPRPRPDARIRLFLVPHAGGAASAYRGWADALPAEVEACPVQLPGRENRIAEPAFDRMDPLVEALAGAIGRLGDLPYAVFGHSTGAVIGFELARHARRTGAPGPVHLFASGRRAPALPARTPDVHHLPDDELVAELATLGGIPAAVIEHRELRQLLVPLLRADMALTETYRYRPEPPLSIPITALAGDRDPKVTAGDAAAWARETAAAFELRTYPGDHFYLASGRDAVVAGLSADLAAIVRRGGTRAAAA